MKQSILSALADLTVKLAINREAEAAIAKRLQLVVPLVDEIKSEGSAVVFADYRSFVESYAGARVLRGEADGDDTFEILSGDGFDRVGDEGLPVAHADEDGQLERLRGGDEENRKERQHAVLHRLTRANPFLRCANKRIRKRIQDRCDRSAPRAPPLCGE